MRDYGVKKKHKMPAITILLIKEQTEGVQMLLFVIRDDEILSLTED